MPLWTNQDTEALEQTENAIAFFDLVWGSEPSEEEVRDARVRLMIKKYGSET